MGQNVCASDIYVYCSDLEGVSCAPPYVYTSECVCVDGQVQTPAMEAYAAETAPKEARGQTLGLLRTGNPTSGTPIEPYR